MKKLVRTLKYSPYKSLFYIAFYFIFVINAKADETGFFLGSSVTNATIQESGYHSDNSYSLNFGYKLSSVYLESNITKIGSFKLKRSSDTKIDLKGFSLLLGKQFNILKELNMNIHGGAILWKADATLLNRSVGDDQDTSAMLGFGISYFFKVPKLSIRSQVQYIFDISGTDIALLSVGLNYHL